MFSKRGGIFLIYNKIKEICRNKKVSISFVEKKANLSCGSISKWNKSSPTIDNLKAVADVLEVSLEELLEEGEVEM